MVFAASCALQMLSITSGSQKYGGMEASDPQVTIASRYDPAGILQRAGFMTSSLPFVSFGSRVFGKTNPHQKAVLP